jgi:hypothetical protein
MAEFFAAKGDSEEFEAKYEGLPAQQIAEREHKHVVGAILDLSVTDNLRTELSSRI